MSAAVQDILAAADWDVLTVRLQDFADREITRYRWRGDFRVYHSNNRWVLANGKGADEFVLEAIEKLLTGQRTYRTDLDPETNLKRIIESDVWNWLKKSKHQPLQDHTGVDVAGEEYDPVENAVDDRNPDNPVLEQELRQRQQQLMNGLEIFVSDDEDLALLLMAYQDQKYKTSEIAPIIGVPAARVSELKRKLSQKADKFLRLNPQFAELKPNLEKA